MNVYIHARLTHSRLARSFETSIDSWPVTIGRGPAATVRLEGDESVSATHASVDLRDGEFVVRDARSTNGTLVAGKPIAADRWVVLGPAEREHTLRVGGWEVGLRAVSGERQPGSAPIGHSGATEVAPALISFMEQIHGLSEPIRRSRDARADLERAVSECLGSVAPEHRADLTRALRAHYVELQNHPAVLRAEGSWSAPEAETSLAALTALDTIARVYLEPEGALTSARAVRAFGVNLHRAIDSFARGLARTLAGVQSYKDGVLEPGDATPPTPEQIARIALASSGGGGGDGATAIRRMFHDLAAHQLASVAAVMAGIRALLEELSPESIEAAVSKGAGAGLWHSLLRWIGPGRAALAEYRRRHRDLSKEESARFRVLFGARFAESYRETVREAKFATQAGTRLLEAPSEASPPRIDAPPAMRPLHGAVTVDAAPRTDNAGRTQVMTQGLRSRGGS